MNRAFYLFWWVVTIREMYSLSDIYGASNVRGLEINILNLRTIKMARHYTNKFNTHKYRAEWEEREV